MERNLRILRMRNAILRLRKFPDCTEHIATVIYPAWYSFARWRLIIQSGYFPSLCAKKITSDIHKAHARTLIKYVGMNCLLHMLSSCLQLHSISCQILTTTTLITRFATNNFSIFCSVKKDWSRCGIDILGYWSTIHTSCAKSSPYVWRFTKPLFFKLMPSALARGFEWGIYSRNVHMYVCTTYVSVMLRNVNLCSRACRGTLCHVHWHGRIPDA